MSDEGIVTTKGKGVDRLGTKKDGLKLKWKWSRVCDLSWPRCDPRREDKRRLPCQCCFAEAGDFRYEVDAWHMNYGAEVKYKGETLIRFDKDIDDTTEYCGEVLLERLQAQLKAENLILEFYKMLNSHIAEYHYD